MSTLDVSWVGVLDWYTAAKSCVGACHACVRVALCRAPCFYLGRHFIDHVCLFSHGIFCKIDVDVGHLLKPVLLVVASIEVDLFCGGPMGGLVVTRLGRVVTFIDCHHGDTGQQCAPLWWCSSCFCHLYSATGGCAAAGSRHY